MIPKGPSREVPVESEETLHRGRVFRVLHQELVLPSGLRQSLDLIEHPGAVAVLARDDDGRMLLVRQYRAAADCWTLEVPAGRLEPAEDPALCALRELEEETGYRAASVHKIRSFVPAMGFCSEVIHIFEAQGLQAVEGGGLACDVDEELDVLWMPPSEVVRQEPADSKTLLAALFALGAEF